MLSPNLLPMPKKMVSVWGVVGGWLRIGVIELGLKCDCLQWVVFTQRSIQSWNPPDTVEVIQSILPPQLHLIMLHVQSRPEEVSGIISWVLESILRWGAVEGSDGMSALLAEDCKFSHWHLSELFQVGLVWVGTGKLCMTSYTRFHINELLLHGTTIEIVLNVYLTQYL